MSKQLINFCMLKKPLKIVWNLDILFSRVTLMHPCLHSPFELCPHSYHFALIHRTLHLLYISLYTLISIHTLILLYTLISLYTLTYFLNSLISHS